MQLFVLINLSMAVSISSCVLSGILQFICLFSSSLYKFQFVFKLYKVGGFSFLITAAFNVAIIGE